LICNYDAVLLIGFGGPTRPEEVRPFLDNVLRGRQIPRERYEEVVYHYEVMGGSSPYNRQIEKQAAALHALLGGLGAGLPVYLGMRNWAPYLLSAISEIARSGARRVLGFVLAPHRCEASWDRYVKSVAEAVNESGATHLKIDYPPPWSNHPLFIDAWTERVRASIAQLDDAERSNAVIVFTAHSIPVAMAGAGTYAQQFSESSRMVAQTLNWKQWSIGYQSRSGNPREPWLEPAIGDIVRTIEGPLIVAPIGFVCDHIEVLYDLDVEAAAAAREAGNKLLRAQTIGEHPRFIEMIASMVLGSTPSSP